MTIVALNFKQLANALESHGFRLVTDLPRPLRIEIRRGAIIARML